MAELLRLINPRPALRDGAEPLFEVTGAGCPPSTNSRFDLAGGATGRTPLIFVHGMEYSSRYEVLRDLVIPFEREAGIFEHADAPFEVHLVHWDSRIDVQREDAGVRALFASGLRAAWSATSLSSRLETLEERARHVGGDLAPLVAGLMDGPKQPLVITHSLGALVWSETLKQVQRHGRMRSPGDWWSLQPALKWNAFSADQEYGCIPQLYARCGARHTVWYSRLDVVLGTLFVAAKRSLALGQVGPGGLAHVRGRDLTRISREAHGQTVVVRQGGPFFQRVGGLLREQARAELTA